MQRHILLLTTLLCFLVITAHAQNTSPYWSLTGNSSTQATATSKLGTTSSIPLNLTTNNVTRLKIFENGRIGIGTGITTANATRVLNLADAQAVMRILRIDPTNAPAVELLSRTSADGANKAYWDMYAEPSDGSFRIRDRVTGSNLDRFTINSNGYLGIGSVTPAMPLHVSRPSDTALLLLQNQTTLANGTNTGLYFGNGSYYTGGIKAIGTGTNTARLSFLTYASASGLSYLKERLTILDNGNVGIGTITPANALDVSGNSAIAGDLHLSGKVYQGNFQLLSAPGNGNTFFGIRSGEAIHTSNSQAENNTAMGQFALVNNTIGGANTAMGYSALVTNTQGATNTAIGDEAMFDNTSGFFNTAVGVGALYSNIDAHGNTAVGGSALYHNTDGSENTAVGESALYGINAENRHGYGNTGIGSGTEVMSDNLSNATAVGYNAVVDASNKVRIGNTNVTSIGGQVGWTNFSDGRYKRNIREDVQGLSFINSLRPITYTVDVPSLNAYYNKARKDINNQRGTDSKAATLQKESEESASKVVYNGFVAQEVERAANKLHYNFSGVDKPQTEDGLYGLRYSDFVVPLVKAVQELSKENDELKKKADRVDELEARLQKLESMLTRNNNTASVSSAYLDNALPNPSNGSTLLRYGLPEGTTAAHLTLTNAKGQVLKEIGLIGRGAGQVNLNTANLPAGVYTYTLLVNGQQAASKQLIIAR